MSQTSGQKVSCVVDPRSAAQSDDIQLPKESLVTNHPRAALCCPSVANDSCGNARSYPTRLVQGCCWDGQVPRPFYRLCWKSLRFWRIPDFTLTRQATEFFEPPAWCRDSRGEAGCYEGRDRRRLGRPLLATAPEKRGSWRRRSPCLA